MTEPLDSEDSDGTLHHLVPVPLLQRLLFPAAGLFVMLIAPLQLWRGLWPLNLLSPVFALLIAGAYAVGLPMALAGLASQSLRWTVRPGRIDIEMTRPFAALTTRRFARDAVAGFDLLEREQDNGPNLWCVVLVTQSGERFASRSYGSQAAAADLRRRVETAFAPRPHRPA